MNNNSKSGLRISEIIATLSAFIIIATSTQLLATCNNVKENNIKTVTQEANIKEMEFSRTIATTSRSGIQRETRQEIRKDEEEIKDSNEFITEEIVEETKKYISIDEIKISKDMDLTVRCGISKEDFKILIKNLKCDTSGFFYENSDIIYDLCQKYELNEVFFCGLIAGESGWKISSNHRNKCNYISMMSKGKLIKYATPEEGLEAAAKLLHTKYLSEGGPYYSGKTLSNVQKRFCPNSSTWVNLIYGCMKQIVK